MPAEEQLARSGTPRFCGEKYYLPMAKEMDLLCGPVFTAGIDWYLSKEWS